MRSLKRQHLCNATHSRSPRWYVLPPETPFIRSVRNISYLYMCRNPSFIHSAMHSSCTCVMCDIAHMWHFTPSHVWNDSLNPSFIHSVMHSSCTCMPCLYHTTHSSCTCLSLRQCHLTKCLRQCHPTHSLVQEQRIMQTGRRTPSLV